MEKRKKLKTVVTHVTVIMLFIVYELPIIIGLGAKAPLIKLGVFYVLNISVFYFFRYGALPYLLNKKSILFRSIGIAILIAGYCILSLSLTIIFLQFYPNPDFSPYAWKTILFTALRGTYILGLSIIFYRFNQDLVRERERSILQQSFLRAQINQHLVFNTLNYTYCKIVDLSADAAKSVELLSDLLRYALIQTKENEKSTIESEVGQINRYIDLNQLLCNHSLQIIFNTEVKKDYEQIEIPSLLLVNLVENIFKHGNLHDPTSPATIYLSIDQYILQFSTENQKHEYPYVLGQNMGLKNCRDRLQLAYQNNFKLNIIETDLMFKLELTIRI